MPTFKIDDIRRRGMHAITEMVAHFLKNVSSTMSIDEIAMGIGLTPELVRKVMSEDGSIKKQAVLNSKGRQEVKRISNSFGLRVNKLSNDDILTFQITRNSQDPKKFLNALNRVGIQYKTLDQDGSNFKVRLWPRGERPSGEKMNNDTKTTGSGLDGSTYIRRALKVADHLRLLAAQPKTIPASELSFELSDSLSQDKGFLRALESLKSFLEKKSDVDKDEMLGWVIGRMAQIGKQIKLLETQLQKTTKTFMSPK